MKLRRNVRYLSGPVDMTPLIDVVLLLIIFFMLSSSFVLQPGVEVSPPVGSLEYGGITDSRYVVNVSAQNPPLIFFNDQRTDMDGLRKDLTQLVADKGEITVVLRADRKVSHGEVTGITNAMLGVGARVVVASNPHEMIQRDR